MSPSILRARCGTGKAASVLTLMLLQCVLSPLQAVAGGNPGAGNQNSMPAMTRAPMKLNGSGVVVRYRVDGTSTAGTRLAVVLDFDGIDDPAGALVRFTVDGGLSLAAGQGSAAQTLPAGPLSTLTVQVVPGASSISYLHVFTSQHGATSAMSIPILVGKEPPALPSTHVLKPTAGGDRILAMPVK